MDEDRRLLSELHVLEDRDSSGRAQRAGGGNRYKLQAPLPLHGAIGIMSLGLRPVLPPKPHAGLPLDEWAPFYAWARAAGPASCRHPLEEKDGGS
ncbi:hypothetical protein NDU88_002563 [Pleurodeles waltl]|uniref:Uncharacterized protein n=1 Tax=Pleurodeles waltl TaxID=8319 RepID=A0AAV7RFP6_PLEWA|nr:hypothetical protein NDU88_002563 [Pleurodeles waltl]